MSTASLTAPEIDPVSFDTPPAPAPRQRRTLLICDDEDGPRESLRVIFRGEYDILAASSGPEAIELAQQHKVDVCISDIRMSGMSGIEVLERLKFVDPGIEVVMMTAFETTDTLRQALKLHACDYINKPFDVSTVRAAVATAVQRRRMKDESSDSADKIQELFAELQHQKLQEQITHARSEIYASILHDINGPLTVISGFAQLMSQRLAKADEPSAEDIEFIRSKVKTILRQTANCQDVTKRYLSFLRHNEDEDHSRVGVNQLLADLNQLVAAHPSLGSHEFNVHPLERDICARMNGTDLLQILRNLAINAFQASVIPHVVDITGRVLDEPLVLEDLKDGPEDRVLNLESFENKTPLLRLSVRDTGPGIPHDILPKVFQAYFTTKPAKVGTGLGLSIIQRLVKQANGILHLRSIPGEGTTFTIYLPAVEISSR